MSRIIRKTVEFFLVVYDNSVCERFGEYINISVCVRLKTGGSKNLVDFPPGNGGGNTYRTVTATVYGCQPLNL